MLRTRHWTSFDTAALLLLCALLFRVSDSDGSMRDPENWYAATEPRRVVQQNGLSRPLPVATEWAASTGPARLDGALRCIALAEIKRRDACGAEHSRACRMAHLDRRIAEFSLWPRGRQGQIAMAYYGRIDRYADAYSGLSEPAPDHMRASSQLIRDRDDAICREYLRFTKAPPHGSEIRQSRRTVQEGAG